MNRFFWIIVVLLCAFITSFLLVLGLGGIVYSGEEAIGIGMLWYYSLPGLVILGVFSGYLDGTLGVFLDQKLERYRTHMY